MFEWQRHGSALHKDICPEPGEVLTPREVEFIVLLELVLLRVGQNACSTGPSSDLRQEAPDGIGFIFPSTRIEGGMRCLCAVEAPFSIMYLSRYGDLTFSILVLV